MNNNDILRRLRYTFDLSDAQMIEIFSLADLEVDKKTIGAWLKKDDEPDYKEIYDIQMSTFLNGFINFKRGKKEGEQPKPEKSLNNNLIFRKIKIALSLRDNDIMEAFELAKLRVSKHEISAIFRHPSQNQYRICKDQFLRNFMLGLQLKYKGKKQK